MPLRLASGACSDGGVVTPVWHWMTRARPEGRPLLTVVHPSVAIGEYPTPEDASWLRSAHGITAVLSLQDDADLAAKGLRLSELEAAFHAAGIRFQRIPIADGDRRVLARRLDMALDVLHGLVRGGHRVYVHCSAGMNRAPTIAIAYLHVHAGHSLDHALALVKDQHACVPYLTVLRARYAEPAGGQDPPA